MTRKGDGAEFNPQFQVGLDVAGRRCLVIGGGAEATDKTRRLLDARADVLVVAPALSGELRGWAEAGRIRHRPRRFRRRDLEGATLVLNTVRSDPALRRQVYMLARRRRIPINTFDVPQYSTMAMAALVTCGHLRISISTSNAAPSLAGRLRQDLEAMCNPAPQSGASELAQYLDALGELRSLAKRTIRSPAERRVRLRALVADFRLTGRVELPPGWRHRLAATRADLEREPPPPAGPPGGNAR